MRGWTAQTTRARMLAGPFIMAWIAYVIAWLAATLFWTMAAASSGGWSPAAALPYAIVAMGTAGTMGVVVWQLTGRVAWNWRAPTFWIIHVIALLVYSMTYSLSGVAADAWSRSTGFLDALSRSPVVVWNLLMGSWLYLMVAALSYAVRFQRRVRAHEDAAAAARLLAKQAQLAALRAQINPHFLFNALHSVGALVNTDPAQADRALERLGDLLRYALDPADAVPFQHEWRFTKDYLAFEQLRLGDRMRVDERIDANTHAVLVPPLILQPLVENAVRHGIADRPEGGHIIVHARLDDTRLLLSVIDDGPGDDTTMNHGLGMQSVQRRLQALYGPNGTLHIGRDAAGFSVTLGIPLQPLDAEEALA